MWRSSLVIQAGGPDRRIRSDHLGGEPSPLGAPSQDSSFAIRSPAKLARSQSAFYPFTNSCPEDRPLRTPHKPHPSPNNRPARHGRLSHIRDNGHCSRPAVCAAYGTTPHLWRPRAAARGLEPELALVGGAPRSSKSRLWRTRRAYGAGQAVSRDHWADSTMRSPALLYPSHAGRSKRLHKLPHSRRAGHGSSRWHRHAFLPQGLDRRDLRRRPSAPVRSWKFGACEFRYQLRRLLTTPYAHKSDLPPLTGDASRW